MLDESNTLYYCINQMIQERRKRDVMGFEIR